jgi:hypothetical protein
MRNKRLKEKEKNIAALSSESRTLEILKQLQEDGMDKNLQKMEKAYSNLFSNTKENENESDTGSNTETETGSTDSVGEKTETETSGDN